MVTVAKSGTTPTQEKTPTEYKDIDAIMTQINSGSLTDEEKGYFNLDGDKDVDKTDILALLDKSGDGKLDKDELAKFGMMDTKAEREPGYTILKEIKGVTDLATTSEEDKKAFKDFFDVDNDSDIDMLDVLSVFDTDGDGAVSKDEKTKGYDKLKTSGSNNKPALDATDLKSTSGKAFQKKADTEFTADSARNASAIQTAMTNGGYNIGNADIETLFGGADSKISDTELRKLSMLDGKAGLTAADFAKISPTDKAITKDEVTKVFPAPTPAPVATAQSKSSSGSMTQAELTNQVNIGINKPETPTS